jgi:hypothetical protein
MQGEQGELDRGEGGGDDIGRDPRR